MKKKAGFKARAPILLLSLAVLLAAAAALRADETRIPTAYVAASFPSERDAADDTRETFKKERDATREQERAALKTLLSDASEALRKDAEDMLLSLFACSEYETQIETALCGMNLTGLSSVNGKCAYVFVDQALSARQAALLFASVQEITGYLEDAIRVSDDNASK